MARDRLPKSDREGLAEPGGQTSKIMGVVVCLPISSANSVLVAALAHQSLDHMLVNTSEWRQGLTS